MTLEELLKIGSDYCIPEVEESGDVDESQESYLDRVYGKNNIDEWMKWYDNQ